MSKIWIATQPILDGVIEHAYIVYDPDGDPNSGDELIWNGYPESSNPLNFGNIEIENWRPILESKDNLGGIGGSDPFADRNYTEVNTNGRTPEQVKDDLSVFAQNLGASEGVSTVTAIPYTIPIQFYNPETGQAGPRPGLNSNTTVKSGLEHAGIDFDANTPFEGGQGSGNGRLSPDVFPGAESYYSGSDGTITIPESDNDVIIFNVDGNNTYDITPNPFGTGQIVIVEDNNIGTIDSINLHDIDLTDVSFLRNPSGNLEIYFPWDTTGNPSIVVPDQWDENGTPKLSEILVYPPDGSNPISVPLSNPEDFPMTLPEPFSDIPQPFSDIPQWLDDLLNDWGGTKDMASPLILDLDGSGIDLASTLNGVYWDIDQDGYAEKSGWISGNDGLLAIDLNSDGVINDHGELFGTDTTDGFTVLSAYDSNADNVIDISDTQFGDFLAWVDVNADGYSQSDELHTLTSLGITSINLNASLVDYDIAGNHVTHESTFTINGQTQTIVDAWFAYDNINSTYIIDYSFDIRTINLPNLRGFGDVKDLNIAMSMDETLLLMVQEVAMSDTATVLDSTFNLSGKVDAIMHRWAGVDSVDSLSRGGYIDARNLEFLEKFLGDNYLQFGTDPNPGVTPADALQDIFVQVRSQVITALFAQTGLKMLDDQANYEYVTGTTDNIDAINNLWFTADDTNARGTDVNDVFLLQEGTGTLSLTEGINGGIDQIWLSGDTESIAMWVDGGRDLYVNLRGTSDTIIINGEGGSATDVNTRIEKFVFVDGTVLDFTQGLIMADSDVGHLNHGSILADQIDGRGGNDDIYGHEGNDILTGGLGNDDLSGGDGNDTYIYQLGDGNDTISETSGTDTLSFGVGIELTDLTFARVGTALEIRISDGSVIEVADYYSGGHGYLVEELQFDDGTTHNLQVLVNTAPIAQDDIFVGDQDIVLTGNVLVDNGNGADSDPESNPLTVVAGVYATAHGSVDVSANGNFVYTPVAGYNGADSFTYNLEDGFGGSDTAIVNITVRPPNIAPIAQDDIFTGDQDIIITGNLLLDNGNGADSDPDSDPMTVVAGTYATTNGSVVVSVNGDFTYTPNAGYVGVDSFTYTLQDDRGGSDTATASFTLNTAINPNAIYGTSASETLNGDQSGVTNDILIGNGGNDFLYGKLGNDKYEWSVGDGNDTIYEEAGIDQLVLHGIQDTDIRIEKFGNFDMRVHVGSEYITVDNQFKSDYYNNTNYDQYQVESILLDDGSTIDLLNNVSLTGTAASETINGLNSGATFIGKAGNDTFNGKSNGDAYEWSVGDGNDTIYDEGGMDQLVLHGVQQSDIRIAKQGNFDLRVHIGTESITIDNQYRSDYYNNSNYDHNQVESILFDDGSTIDLLNYMTLVGTASGETINGFNAATTFIGKAGNDTFNGKSNGDSFEWSVGDGNDTIYDEGGIDQLVLQGILQTDIRLEKFGNFDLRVHVGSEYVTVDNQFRSDYYNNTNYDQYQVESILLDNGSTIDLLNNLTFTGTSSGETINGLNANDSLYGLDGNDTLNGKSGNDILNGGNGSDYLYGNEGDDVLYGGAGIDMLYGDAGADTFVFESASAFTSSDNIQDFNLAEGDKLDISDLLVGYDPLVDAITDFVQITEAGANSYLNVDADGGANNFVQVAYIFNETGLTDEDALETSGNLIAA